MAGFTLIDRLDRDSGNAFGEVWLAQASEPFQRVAIKFVRPDRARPDIVRRFAETESSAMARLNHPYIAQFKQFGHDLGEPFIVMEYVAGAPICAFCDKHRLGIRERLALMAKVCEAVQAIHSANLIHRDLKPQNILVTWDRATAGSEPVPKLIDFGLARSDNPDAPIAASVVSHMGLWGTPAYASPEQHQRLRAEEIGKEADIYALGSVLFELMTGVTPVHGFCSDERLTPGQREELLRTADRPGAKDAFQALGAGRERIALARGESVESLAAILGSRVTHVLDKALRFQPSDRFSSARIMAADLRAILEERDFAEAALETGWERPRRTYRRHRPLWIATGAAVVALAAGATLSTWFWIVAANQRDTAQRTLDFLTSDVLDPPDELGEQDLGLLDVLRLAVPNIDGAFDGDPSAEARVRLAIARSAAALGSFELATAQADQAHVLSESIVDAALAAEAKQVSLEVESRQVLRSGTVDDAEELLGRLRAERGNDDPAVLGTMLQVANLHKKRAGQDAASCDRAAALYGDLLALRTDRDGPDALATLIVRHNMNLLHRIKARKLNGVDRARALEASLNDRLLICRDTEAALGDGHWQSIASRAEWLGLLADLSRFDEAVRGYPSTIDDMDRALGPANWRTIETTARYGRALMKRAGERPEPHSLQPACDLLASALEGYRRFNADSDDHLKCAKWLIECLEAAKDIEAARWYLARTERLLADRPAAAPESRAEFAGFASTFRTAHPTQPTGSP